MKSILAFGDSLTWGYDAATSLRHPFDVRWPNAMAATLGPSHHIISEGLNGRTTSFDDDTDVAELNGARALPMLLKSHQPLDLVIIMLGTNDLKFANRCRAFDAAMGMGRLIEIIKHHPFKTGYPTPQILIVSPPHLVLAQDEWFAELWGHAIDESKKLPTHYARVAEENGVHFFNANSVAKADPRDGGHMDAAATKALGVALADVAREILKV